MLVHSFQSVYTSPSLPSLSCYKWHAIQRATSDYIFVLHQIPEALQRYVIQFATILQFSVARHEESNSLKPSIYVNLNQLVHSIKSCDYLIDNTVKWMCGYKSFQLSATGNCCFTIHACPSICLSIRPSIHLAIVPFWHG